MAEILAASTQLVEASLPPTATWQRSLKQAIRSGHQLLESLGLPTALGCSSAQRDFPVFVPQEYARRMRPSDPRDPLLLQVLATAQETMDTAGRDDPVGDRQSEVIPGLLHKYVGRALLITSGACAVHCRYCFRRHFPYHQAPVGPVGWQPAIQAIDQDASITEVILSGGDPLSVVDESLSQLVEQLNTITHLHRIRIHTRFPVVIPSRVCQSMVAWIRSSRCPIYCVLHFNHPAEIDSEVKQSLRELRQAGAVLLNQSVLLRGVNDCQVVQRELCEKLVNSQVLPYYLHQLDPVRGAMHFAVSDIEAQQILTQLRSMLPGYAVPRLVRELAGHPSKIPVPFE
ncbi:MAG: EF-P beta-lysylation protein EpmB [Pirellulaceae bacterium]|nr:EF-P beta-lysylation protein EpmB [Pirellulaceae bacterium]